MTRAELEARPGWEAKGNFLWFKDGFFGMEFYDGMAYPVSYSGGLAIPWDDLSSDQDDDIDVSTVERIEKMHYEVEG